MIGASKFLVDPSGIFCNLLEIMFAIIVTRKYQFEIAWVYPIDIQSYLDLSLGSRCIPLSATIYHRLWLAEQTLESWLLFGLSEDCYKLRSTMASDALLDVLFLVLYVLLFPLISQTQNI